MTEKEFNEIENLITGLSGTTEHKNTMKRCDKALDILRRNKQLMLGGVVFNEAEDCSKCFKPKRTKPNTIQMLCECDNSEVELCECKKENKGHVIIYYCQKPHDCQEWEKHN